MMEYKDYKKIAMKHDNAQVVFDIDIWDFTESYFDENVMSRDTRTIKELEDRINYYLMSGFAVIEQIPRY